MKASRPVWAAVLLVVLSVLGVARSASGDIVCCNRTTGACTFVAVGNCPPGTVQILTGGCSNCLLLPGLGACCLPSGGGCVNVYQSQCTAQGGTWLGLGISCTTQPCDWGACCIQDDPGFVTCSGLFRSQCRNLNGRFIGAGTICTPLFCDEASGAGACCDRFGACEVGSQAGCQANGSVFRGMGTTCSPTACDSLLGACCTPSTCEVLTSFLCAGQTNSVFLGGGTTCALVSCGTIFGACCDGSGGCTTLTDVQCGSTRLFLGGGTTCGPSNPCGVGRCCLTTGECENRVRINCNAPNVFVLNSLCDPFINSCPQPTGACCDGTGGCTLMTLAGCDNGRLFLGIGTTCVPNDPCGFGRCCIASTGACVVRFRVDCVLPDLYTPQSLCDPFFNNCPQPTGACCDTSNGVCSVTGPLACGAPNLYLGNGSACLPYPCPPANDDCAGAVPLSATPFFVFGTTRNASTTGQTTLDCGQFGTSDVFYTFVPPTTGDYRLGLCQTQVIWDTSLSVHSSCPPSASNILACGVDCDPAPSFFDLTFIPSLTLQAGTAYTIRVASAGPFAESFGEFRLDGELLVGACCVPPGLCLELNSGLCQQWGGNFQGADTLCTPSPCPPPCPADFNASGTLSVQDIFDFLAAYFALDAAADFNGVGGLSVQDIFDFLAAYFAGCP